MNLVYPTPIHQTKCPNLERKSISIINYDLMVEPLVRIVHPCGSRLRQNKVSTFLHFLFSIVIQKRRITSLRRIAKPISAAFTSIFTLSRLTHEVPCPTVARRVWISPSEDCRASSCRWWRHCRWWPSAWGTPLSPSPSSGR